MGTNIRNSTEVLYLCPPVCHLPSPISAFRDQILLSNLTLESVLLLVLCKLCTTVVLLQVQNTVHQSQVTLSL